MSWSITLSGPRKQVLAELDGAEQIIQQAQSMAGELDEPILSVSLSGYAYRGSSGSGLNNAVSVSGSTPQEPAPPPADQAVQTDAAPPVELEAPAENQPA